MANLLPQHHIKRLKRERVFRIVTVSITTLFVVVVITALALLPSYFVARTNELAMSDEIAILRQILEKREEGDAASEARELRAELGAVTQMENTESVTVVLNELFQDLPSNIEVVSMVLGDSDVKVSGVAGTRDSLLAYRTTLESNDMFGSVPLDISTLAQQFDIVFTLEIPLTGGGSQPEADQVEDAGSDRGIQGT